MSLWYQATPNGAVGCWITNRSKPVLTGMPVSVTFMVSLIVPVVMVACPAACGRQAVMAGDDALSGNENEFAVAGAAEAAGIAANAAVRPMADTAAAVAKAARIEGRVMLMTGPPVRAASPAAGLAVPPGGRRPGARAGVRAGMPEWFNAGMGIPGPPGGAGGISRFAGAVGDDMLVTELYRKYHGPLLLFVVRLMAG